MSAVSSSKAWPHLMSAPCTDAACLQELDLQDLQQQLLARDADFEELQQQWNLQNFKFCLLVDMVRTAVVLVLDATQHILSGRSDGALTAFLVADLQTSELAYMCMPGLSLCHLHSIWAVTVALDCACSLQWAVRVLDNEELARQADVPLQVGTGRITKLSK